MYLTVWFGRVMSLHLYQVVSTYQAYLVLSPSRFGPCSDPPGVYQPWISENSLPVLYLCHSCLTWSLSKNRTIAVTATKYIAHGLLQGSTTTVKLCVITWHSKGIPLGLKSLGRLFCGGIPLQNGQAPPSHHTKARHGSQSPKTSLKSTISLTILPLVTFYVKTFKKLL